VSALGGAAAAVAGMGAGIAAAGLADSTVALPAAAPVATPATGSVPYTPGEPPRRRTGIYVALLVVLLLLVAGILFFVGRNLGSATADVTVPNVIGRSALDAQNELQGLGFKVNTTEQQNDRIPEGEVFDQDPKGNVRAEEGSVVNIVVSSGVGKVQVPDVVGRTQAQATSLLSNEGFRAEVVQEPSDDRPAGEVLSQDPAAGTEQDRGSSITIVVSSGVAQVAVPSVAGDDLAGASATLGAAGFRVTSTQQSSTTVASGTVITTNPTAGTQMAKGSTVQVIVSSGPPATTTTTTAPTTTTTTGSTTTQSTQPAP
jgi:beta-lactam-binding protein with PASTA domain